jgi:hypothetical protein
LTESAGASPRGLSQFSGTMPEWSERAERAPAVGFVDSCLRGVGQVGFMNNPITGLAILVAMCVGELWLGFAGALGLVEVADITTPEELLSRRPAGRSECVGRDAVSQGTTL